MSPSYDAETGHLFITFREFGDRYFKRQDEYKAGRVYVGGKTTRAQRTRSGRG
jgi:hypothetical protein